ncbi:hypothetical protein MKY91_20455 [Alkalicoccobacillus gibsonii]|uniref:Uncharacterized protein n=1 Tax=Alkalicoccobacillus gibsonii TaxID=79881 RepID=A0ABU9VP92_9BACI
MNIKILNGEKRIVPIENYSTGNNKGLYISGVIFSVTIVVLLFLRYLNGLSESDPVLTNGEFILGLIGLVAIFGIIFVIQDLYKENKINHDNLSVYANDIFETSNIRLPLKDYRDSIKTKKARIMSKNGMEHAIINPLDQSLYINYEEDDFKKIYLQQVFQKLFPLVDSPPFQTNNLKKITLLKSRHTSVPLALVITEEKVIYSVTSNQNEIFISKHKEEEEFTEKHEWIYSDMEAFKRITLAKGAS